MSEPSPDEGMWLDDLQRCDGFNPCGKCNRCTEGGRPWRELYVEWKAELREERDA